MPQTKVFVLGYDKDGKLVKVLDMTGCSKEVIASKEETIYHSLSVFSHEIVYGTIDDK